MTKKNSTKRALIASILVLSMCFTMLVGTTFAWFTDSVTSSGNVIKSGKLDVELYYADGTLDPATVAWADASKEAIFNYDKWEPGYTDAKHIKVANEGTLDLMWQLAIVPNGTISKLADVIDVYYVTNATAVANRADVDTAWYVGSLAKVINTGIAFGDLTVADKEYTATIVLKMQEDAGNEYQELSVGDSFSVQLIATQLSSENDSFNNEYDKDIVWDGTVPTEKPDSLVVDTEAHLISINDIQAFAYLNTLVNDPNFYDNYGSKWKYTVELNTDIDLFNRAWTPIVLQNFVAFEGNGHTIRNLRVSTTGNSAGLFGVVSCNDIGVTYVRNINIDGAIVSGNKYVGALIGSGTQAAVENATVNNAAVSGVKYVGGIFGSGNGSVNGSTVKNTTITIDQIVIDPADNTIDSKEAGGLIGYLSNDGKATTENKVIANNTVENVTITAPSVASGLVAQPNSSNKGGALIEIKNNTMKNVVITTTADDSAALYVSNNVGGKSIVEQNTATDCSLSVVVSDSEGLANALKGSEKNISIVLSSDVDIPISSLGQQTGGSGEYKLGGEDTETITIDLNGYKMNITTTYWSSIGAKNDNAIFTIKNGTMTSSQATGTWNSYDVTFANCNYVIENVVFDKAIAFTNANRSVSMTNVTINETHDYYALWISAKGQNVEINGLTVNSAGRGIKIDEEYVEDSVAKVTLSVSNAVFNTNKKAAIVVKSAKGADITLSNVDIDNTIDTIHTVWVDEDAAQYADLVTVSGGEKANEGEIVVSAEDLQSKLNKATGNAYLEFINDITGDVTVTQKPDVQITIDGNGKTYAGVITVDGKSSRYATAALTIQNVNFDANGISADACIRLGYVDAARYTNNVTVKDCTFNGTGSEKVAIKSYTGGDWNLTLDNLTVNQGMHSMLQVANVEKGLKIVDCKVYSKNGINLNNTPSLEMSGCTFDVQGYAVRLGVSGSTVNGTFTISNSSLKSANDDGDAVIIFRGTMTGSTVTITDTTLVGNPEITGTANVVR